MGDGEKNGEVNNLNSEFDPASSSQLLNTEASTPAPQSPIARTTVGQAKVAILLATYQGQHYLAEQLNSFAAQTHQNWEVWASDDGSSDNTRSILEYYKKHWPAGRLSISSGPAHGVTSNFVSLIFQTRIRADYYSYADQDDIWEADKLSRAIALLQSMPLDIPALYCSRTRIVDMDNREICLSQLFKKPASFTNALVQNIGGGNTMVFNNSTRELLCEAGEKLPVVAHDWWTYMLVSGCGGRIFYDAKPTLRYRQHGNNLEGTNSTWAGRLKRIRMLWQGRFKEWNDINLRALMRMQHKLTPGNLRVLEQFAAARRMRLLARLFHLKRSGVHRQTLLGNLGLVVAAICRKM